MANSTVEDIAQTQAKQEEKHDQFEKRFERMQVESDNTRSELTHAINRLFDKIDDVNNKIDDVNSRMDASFRDLRNELKQEIQSAKQEFGTTRNWQISCVITAVIAVCAVVGLGITLFH